MAGPGDRLVSIPAPKNSIAAMLARGMTAADIRNQAPEAHRQLDLRMGIKTEEDVNFLSKLALGAPLPPVKQVQAAVGTRWRRGDTARDVKYNATVTILEAGVKRAKDGTMMHRVASGGASWLAKESRLKSLK